MSAGASYEEFKKHCQESGMLFLVLKIKKKFVPKSKVFIVLTVRRSL